MQPGTSVMGLHLRCRLWIAEMNADMTVLRIFDDYIGEMSERKSGPEVRAGIKHFQSMFEQFRRDSDELRHELHLLKMQLASLARDNKALSDVTGLDEHQDTIKKRYTSYRKEFDAAKYEFDVFENKWLS